MFLFWVVVVAGVIVIVVLAVNKKSPTGGSSPVASNTGASTGSSGNTGSATTAPASTTTTNASVAQTLQSQNGSGVQSLPQFTVASTEKGWLIHYLFDCSGRGSKGDFQVYVQDSKGRTVAVAANQLGTSGGSTYYSDTPGTYHLQVNSQCRWTVVVQTIPQ